MAGNEAGGVARSQSLGQSMQGGLAGLMRVLLNCLNMMGSHWKAFSRGDRVSVLKRLLGCLQRMKGRDVGREKRGN